MRCSWRSTPSATSAPSLLRFDAFTRVIYAAYRSSFDRTAAAVLSVLLVLITVAITVARRARRGGERARAGGARRPHTVRLGGLRWPAAAAAAVIVGVALVFPIASLLYWFATGLSAGVDVAHLATSAVSTFWFSVLGRSSAPPSPSPSGLAARYGDSTSFVEHASFAGHALPGIVVALALVFFGARVAQPIYQRTPLLVIAYAVLFIPAAIGAVRSAVAMSPVRTEEARAARAPGRCCAG